MDDGSNTEITKRAAELRTKYAREMQACSKEHSRGNKSASQSHYAAALSARDELNALGFDLFGKLGGER